MTRNAEHGEPEREAIHQGKEKLYGDDSIDEAGEDAAREDSVFFYQL